jgi:hypothetical protein
MPTNNYPGIGYKTQGKDYDLYQEFSVTATTFGGSSVSGTQPDYIITFKTQGVMFLNLGSGAVEVSFNGNTVHAVLDSTNASAGLTFDSRVVTMIWFRVKSGSSGPIKISLAAWAQQ